MATKDVQTAGRPLGILWSERCLNLLDLLSETTLPTVVKMNAEDKSKERKNVSALLQQPLLLYKESKGFKLMARNVSSLVVVKTSKTGIQYKEGGSVIVLPIDYPGWFRILDEDTVPILNVSEIAKFMPKSFLSAKRITGFTLLDPLNNKDIMYEKLEFPVGVYNVHSVYEDYVKYTDIQNAFKRKLLRCLVCVSEDGIDVLIPFDATGEFYLIERRQPNLKVVKTDKNSCAYTLKQLVAMGVFTRSSVLKLLKGAPPSKPCGFTGIMKVFDIVQDWTVVALTLDGKRELLELPVLPFPVFTLSLNGKDLLENGALRAELMFMNGGTADRYIKEIKVKASFALKKTSQEPDVDITPQKRSIHAAPSNMTDKTPTKFNQAVE